MWMTYTNLNDGFDAWSVFTLKCGCSVEEGDNIIFTKDQQCHICNIDETNFSLDESDSGHGSQPSSSITIKFCSCPGTAQNITSISSTLTCGSNSAGEAMPLHIMFSSDATNEEDNSINAMFWT